MNDLISRKAAIELIHSLYPSAPFMRRIRERREEKYKPFIETEKALELLPSAQPEREEGRWMLVKVYEDEYGNEEFNFRCSECGSPAYEFSQPYCHKCGARMDLEENDD